MRSSFLKTGLFFTQAAKHLKAEVQNLVMSTKSLHYVAQFTVKVRLP